MGIAKWAGAVALVAMSATASANYTSTFDTGAEGFTGGGGLPSFSWVATGGIGNSGYIRAIDLAGGQMVMNSPALGNLASLVGGTFSFGYNALGLSSGNVYTPNNAFGSVTLWSGSSYVKADLIPNISAANNIVGTGWHTASLGLIDNLWLGNASLSNILANVTMVSIDVEYDTTKVWPDEVVGIDNFSFRGLPGQVGNGAVPEPATGALMLVGLVGAGLAARRRKR